MLKVKRVYDPPSADDGFRILVDRLWARGLTREKAKVDLWLKEIAPSDELRHWYAHDPAKWTEFKNRYFTEEGGPIGVMLEEHGWGRDFVNGMRESAGKYKQGDRLVAPKFVENARNYVKLLNQHIDKEDNILYAMADMHLDEKKQAELLAGFAKIEEERLGAGKHEELHEMLRHLVSVYLK